MNDKQNSKKLAIGVSILLVVLFGVFLTFLIYEFNYKTYTYDGTVTDVQKFWAGGYLVMCVNEDGKETLFRVSDDVIEQKVYGKVYEHTLILNPDLEIRLIYIRCLDGTRIIKGVATPVND